MTRGLQDWYDLKGQPYMLGLLLHGQPGTGKTSTIKAIANMTQRHIITVSLESIKTKRQLKALFHDERLHVETSEKREGVETYRIPINKRLFVLEVCPPDRWPTSVNAHNSIERWPTSLSCGDLPGMPGSSQPPSA